jgi:hypothetical protein
MSENMLHFFACLKGALGFDSKRESTNCFWSCENFREISVKFWRLGGTLEEIDGIFKDYDPETEILLLGILVGIAKMLGSTFYVIIYLLEVLLKTEFLQHKFEGSTLYIWLMFYGLKSTLKVD